MCELSASWRRFVHSGAVVASLAALVLVDDSPTVYAAGGGPGPENRVVAGCPDPADPQKPDEDCGGKNSSSNPVRYAHLQLELSENDLPDPLGLGFFGHTLTYLHTNDKAQGWGQHGPYWYVEQWPHMERYSLNDPYYVQLPGRGELWFDYNADSTNGDTFDPPDPFVDDAKLEVVQILTTAKDEVILTWGEERWGFNPYLNESSAANSSPGNKNASVPPGGPMWYEAPGVRIDYDYTTLTTTDNDPAEDDKVISSITRTFPNTTGAKEHRIDYAYTTVTASDYIVQSATFSTTDAGNTNPVVVSTVYYEYDSSRRPQYVNFYDGARNSGNPETNRTGRKYLKYTGDYLSLILDQEGYRRYSLDEDVTTDPPDSQSDSALADYAKQQFEFESDPLATSIFRLSSEVSNGCGSCGNSGTSSGEDFSRIIRPGAGTGVGDPNVWRFKTTVVKSTHNVSGTPAKVQDIVYTNAYGGQVILKLTEELDSSGLVQARTGVFYRYDTDGREIWRVDAGALDIDASTNLSHIEDGNGSLGSLVNNPGSAIDYLDWIHDSEGLVEITEYGDGLTSDHPTDEVYRRWVREGDQGTAGAHSSDVLLHEYEYVEHPVSSPRLARVKTRIDFPDASDQTKKITTSYSYTLHSGSSAIASRTTTLPAVPTTQNGSGVASSVVEYFDIFGNPTWRKDERGIVTHWVYGDSRWPTLVTQRIDDADTGLLSGVPSGIGGNRNANVVGAAIHAVTDYEYDEHGRLVETLYPQHKGLVGGSMVDVRRAMWRAYVEGDETLLDAVRTATGYKVVSGGAETIVGSATVNMMDKTWRRSYADIEAICASVTELNDSAWNPVEDITGLVSRTFTTFNQVEAVRRYFDLPTGLHTTWTVEDGGAPSGTGGTNYDEMTYAYEHPLRLQTLIESFDGTLTRMVYDEFGEMTATWVGTDDTGATYSDPSNSGASGNNMKQVTGYEYFVAGSRDGKNGNLKKVTQHIDGTTTRVINYTYDYRNRRVTMDGEEDRFVKTTYDNLTRPTIREQKDTDDTGTLLSKTEPKYDDRGRIYESLVYNVGTSNALVTQSWYDPSGMLAKQTFPEGGFIKSAYDGLGRTLVTWSGYDTTESTYAHATDKSGASDVVVTETSYGYQSSGPLELVTEYSRDPDEAESTVGLLSANAGSSRIRYAAMWVDGAGRPTHQADYGTTDPGTPSSSTPPVSSATILVSQTAYDDEGMPHETTAPDGLVTRTFYDDADRTTHMVENYVAAKLTGGDPDTPAARDPDENRITKYTYTPDGQTKTLTAIDPDHDGNYSDNQTTKYVYGTTLTDSDLATNSLLRATIYPDSDDADSPLGNGSDTTYDRVELTYNRAGEVKTRKDQRGITLAFTYDGLGRPLSQAVSAGTVDGDQKLAMTYTDRGELDLVRTYSDAAGTTLASEIDHTYNGLGQLTAQIQDHTPGTLGSAKTASYAYDLTSSGGVISNGARPTTLTYPNGRLIKYRYGDLTDGNTWDNPNAYLSRADGIIEGTAGTMVLLDDPIVTYQYWGNGQLGTKDYSTGSLRLDRIGVGSDGYDVFDRVTQQRWETYDGTGTDVAAVFDIAHDYDQASNRLNAVRSVYKLASQVYGHDGLNRLTSFEAGEYDSTADAIEDVRSFDRRLWDYDQLGNQQSVESLEDPASPTNPYTASTFNDANEIATRSVQAKKRSITLDDFEDSATASLWQGVSGASFTVDSGGNGLLSTTGTGTNIVLFSEESAGSAALSVRVSSVTANQNAGLVFGYLDASTYYRVVYERDGTFSLLNNSGVLATTTATGNLYGVVTVSVEITETGVICRLTERGRGSGFDVAELTYAFPAGAPVGRVGVYANPDTDATAINFDKFTWTEGARATPLGVAWDNYANNVWIDTTFDQLVLDADNLFDTNADVSRRPVLLRAVHGDRFRIDFEAVKTNDITQKFRVHFNAQDPEDSDYLVIPMVDGSGQGEAPSGYEVTGGSIPTLLTATETDVNTLDWTTEDPIVWVRIESDGTDLTVYQATTEAGLDTASACYETTVSTDRFVMSGGRIGFACDTDAPAINQVKVYLDLNADDDFGDANELQHDGDFTLDSNGYEQVTVEHDAAGNLTYDGAFRYIYDAWNRLVEVRKAVSSTVDGATIAVYRYDGLGRRITRSLQHRGDATITYHDYWSSNWQLLETHDASANVLKQHVWGLDYIDELIQVAVNRDVYIDTEEDQCEQVYFALQDAHYNVIGLATAKGHLVERYEYTPYGERKVYSQPQPLGDLNGDGVVDTEDVDIVTDDMGEPTAAGDAWMYMDMDGDEELSGDEYQLVLGSVGMGAAEGELVTRGMSRGARTENYDGALTYAISDIGHQGLMHDEEIGMVYNRARYRGTRLARWLRRDPLGYVDQHNLYEYINSNSLIRFDPSGLISVTTTTPQGYIDISGADAWALTMTRASATGQCVECKNDEDPDKCWKYTEANVNISATIYLNLEKLKRKGNSVAGVYGHEEIHVKLVMKEVSKLMGELEEQARNSILGVNEGSCMFETKDDCQEFVTTWSKSLEEELSRKHNEAIARAGGHAGDDGAPVGAPEAGKEYPPSDGAKDPVNLGGYHDNIQPGTPITHLDRYFDENFKEQIPKR